MLQNYKFCYMLLQCYIMLTLLYSVITMLYWNYNICIYLQLFPIYNVMLQLGIFTNIYNYYNINVIKDIENQIYGGFESAVEVTKQRTPPIHWR